MNDPIYNELSKKIKLPNINVDTIFISELDTSINRHCGTKQTIELTADEVKDILNEKECKLPEFLLKFDDGLNQSDVSKYKDLKDGYQVSEYFSNSDTYIPTFDYFRAVKFGNINCIINIYNGNNCKIPFRQILNKITIQSKTDEGSYKEMNPFKKVYGMIKYAEFNNDLYDANTRINKYMYKFPTLCVNLPYEYYKDQDVPENIFTWDINNKKLSFAGKTMDEVNELFDDICTQGLIKPLYFQISQGKIVSASDEDFIKLIIAQYLKLPTIPAVIYVLNNRPESNMLTSMRPCDIINAKVSNFNTDDETYEIINDICNPYIIFNNSNYNKMDVRLNNKIVYRPIFNNHPINNYNEFYIASDSDNIIEEENEFDSMSVEEIHAKLFADTQKSIDNDIENALQRLESIIK